MQETSKTKKLHDEGLASRNDVVVNRRVVDYYLGKILNLEALISENSAYYGDVWEKRKFVKLGKNSWTAILI